MGGRQEGRASLPSMDLERAGPLEEATNDGEEAGILKEARNPDGTEAPTEITYIVGPASLRLGSARGFLGFLRHTRHTSHHPHAS